MSIAGAVLAGVETSALITGVSNAESGLPLPPKLTGPWHTFEIVTPLAIMVIVALAVMIYARAFVGQAAHTIDPPSSQLTGNTPVGGSP